MCDYFDDNKCKSKEEIKEFLTYFYFKLYTIKTRVKFKNHRITTNLKDGVSQLESRD